MTGRGGAYRERADTTASQQVAEALAVLEGVASQARQIGTSIGELITLAAKSREVEAQTSLSSAARLIESLGDAGTPFARTSTQSRTGHPFRITKCI